MCTQSGRQARIRVAVCRTLLLSGIDQTIFDAPWGTPSPCTLAPLTVFQCAASLVLKSPPSRLNECHYVHQRARVRNRAVALLPWAAVLRFINLIHAGAGACRLPERKIGLPQGAFPAAQPTCALRLFIGSSALHFHGPQVGAAS